MRTLPVGEAFSRHIELSERVIRTVMMMMMMQSSSARHNNNGGGACGVLFENGMVRSSSAGAREVNIVALASLRGSVSQLKANCGGSCSWCMMWKALNAQMQCMKLRHNNNWSGYSIFWGFIETVWIFWSYSKFIQYFVHLICVIYGKHWIHKLQCMKQR